MNNPIDRSSFLSQRQALTTEQINHASKNITQHFLELPEYDKAKHIAAYFPIKHEVCTFEIIHHAQQLKKSIYLPVIQNELLNFYSHDTNDILIDNIFKTPEPNTYIKTKTTTDKLDIIILPCIACDPYGHRVGYGKGFYDRTLAFMENSPHKPLYIMLAYDLQMTTKITPNPWDITANIIITETGIIYADKPNT